MGLRRLNSRFSSATNELYTVGKASSTRSLRFPICEGGTLTGGDPGSFPHSGFQPKCAGPGGSRRWTLLSFHPRPHPHLRGAGRRSSWLACFPKAARSRRGCRSPSTPTLGGTAREGLRRGPERQARALPLGRRVRPPRVIKLYSERCPSDCRANRAFPVALLNGPLMKGLKFSELFGKRCVQLKRFHF